MIAALLWLWIASSAHAALVTATYCVDYSLAFADGSSGDLLTGSTVHAHGVVLRFEWTSGGGGSTDLALDWDGASPGCKTTLVENSSAPFTVRILRRAQIDGNTLEVVDDTGTLLSSLWLTNHTPTNNGSYSTTIGPVSSGSINVLAAGGWAMQRRSGGITGETFRFVLDTCPTGSGSCFDWPDEIYIDADHVDDKFAIAHELGHAVSYKAAGSGLIKYDYDATLDCLPWQDCCTPAYSSGGHKMNSKEYQSAAAVEGIAHFYSAVAFNKDNESDCEMEKHYNPDWDANGTTNGAADQSIFDCEHAPVAGYGLSGGDYFGDKCTILYTDNRATEYDYLRMFWDLRTDGGLTVSEIMEIFDAANPQTWNKTGNGTGGAYPAERLHDAADAVGGAPMQNIYDTWAVYNGTHR